MINRVEEIKKKGFSMINEAEKIDTFNPIDFSKIKVGLKTLDNAVLSLGSFKKLNPKLANKDNVLNAINKCDYREMREISNFFYKTSGIYQRLCRYMAYMYRYDWMVTPYINSEKEVKEEKLLTSFHQVLNYFDNFEVKRVFGEIALKVIKNGCFYGYVVTHSGKSIIQELPVDYCRSRFTVNNKPVVEFNMKFFDVAFKDAAQRMKILKLFPEEFRKGYILYKEGKLPPEYQGDTSGWYLLDTAATIKFNLNGEDFPMFMAVIPEIISLDEGKDLDRQRIAQKLLKIIIQKMPIDKNGDLVFDVDEAAQLHNNAVRMLGKAVGVDVLTTFADVDVADMGDNANTTATDDLERQERSVYNEAGVSQNQFNTDGNLALEKSILNDEATLYNLIQQFESFLNELLIPFNTSPKKIYYRIQILPTTIYNYKEIAKLYKEQMQVGYSKMLSQIAMGQSQSSILANVYFENDILDLINVFIPPLMSSTMSAEMLNKSANGETGSTGGRPEKADDQKSEKTIQNKESSK